MVILSTPVVHDGLEFWIVVLNLFKPLTTVFVTTFDIIDISVGEHDVKDRKNEHECAHEGLSLQIVGGEVGHHATLIADHHKEGRVRGSLNHATLWVNLFAVDVQKIETVDQVTQKTEEGSCNWNERNGGTEKDANG